MRAAAAGEPFAMSPGQQVRDFCPVQDIAAAIVKSLDCQRRDRIEVINLGSGQELPLVQPIRGVCDELGLAVELQLVRQAVSSL